MRSLAVLALLSAAVLNNASGETGHHEHAISGTAHTRRVCLCIYVGLPTTMRLPDSGRFDIINNFLFVTQLFSTRFDLSLLPLRVVVLYPAKQCVFSVH